jgi:hypothetical protein
MRSTVNRNSGTEDGYLRLSTSYSNDTYLIIWPKGYSVKKKAMKSLFLMKANKLLATIGEPSL